MGKINSRGDGCIKPESKIQLECANCPEFFRGKSEVCDEIKKKTAEILYSGK